MTIPVSASDKAAHFMRSAPAAERLHRARATVGLLVDQCRILRVVAEMDPALTAQCINEIGTLLERLEGEL